MDKTWVPRGFKKPAHETATLENFLSLLETRVEKLYIKFENPTKYNLDDIDRSFLLYEINTLEHAMTMAYDMAHRGYDTVINTNYARGN